MPLYERVNRQKKEMVVNIVNPPTPTSMFCREPDADGRMFYFLAPSAGTLNKITVSFRGEKNLRMSVELRRVNGDTLTNTFEARPGTTQPPQEYDLFFGDVISVSQIVEEGKKPIKDVGLSFLYSVKQV